jgi:hypothetical protein
MQNPWLNVVKSKQMMREIDEIAMEVWGDDGNLSDFFAALTDEQTDFLFSMKIKDFACDLDDMTCGFELSDPE